MSINNHSWTCLAQGEWLRESRAITDQACSRIRFGTLTCAVASHITVSFSWLAQQCLLPWVQHCPTAASLLLGLNLTSLRGGRLCHVSDKSTSAPHRTPKKQTENKAFPLPQTKTPTQYTFPPLITRIYALSHSIGQITKELQISLNTNAKVLR